MSYQSPSEFWDAKNLYFRRLDNRDLTPQQRANCRLLKSLLDKAYQAGFDNGRKVPLDRTGKLR